VNVRVIVCTHRDPQQLMPAGSPVLREPRDEFTRSDRSQILQITEGGNVIPAAELTQRHPSTYLPDGS
jgi:hypothetical protein